MNNSNDAREMKLKKILEHIEDGYYFNREIYELIAEKILRELLYKK